MIKRPPRWAALLLVAGMSVGCAAREMVLVDPRVDLQHEIGRRVLVLPVQSQVPVPSEVLASTTIALRESLAGTEGLTVLQATEGGALPQNPDAEAVQAIAAAQKADVVVLARVPEFWERQLRDFAQRHSIFAGDSARTASSWADRPRAEVLLRVVVGFYDGSTGRLLWQREALSGESDEAPLAETATVTRQLYRAVAKQIGEQVVSDLHPYFTYSSP